MFKKALSVFISFLLMLSLISCGTKPTEEKFGKVAILYYDCSDGYTYDLSAAIEAVLSDAAVEFDRYDSQNNSELQLTQAEEAISSGISCLAVNIVDTSSSETASKIVELASASDIPVIFFDRYVDTTVVDSYNKCVYIGTSFEEACKAQGNLIKTYLYDNFDTVDVDDNGIIRYVSYLSKPHSDSIALNEINGALAAAGLSNMEPCQDSGNQPNLTNADAGWTEETAESKLSTILDKLGEDAPQMIELVYADNTEAAIGAYRALKSHNLSVPVFALGCTDALAELIDSGAVTGSISSDTSSIAMAVTAVVTNVIAGSGFFTDVTSGTITGNYLYLSAISVTA